jgi:DtxR family transcriptional regulator, Mn-dependent transcriptional regulator
MSWPWIILLTALLLGVVLWPGTGAWAQLRRQREMRRRALVEDALKHVLTWERRRQDATPESLRGTLGVSESRLIELIENMEQAGLVQSIAGGLHLTPKGESMAVHVVRAHRLWERYLADDAGMPLGRLHQAAEKAEHQLSAEALEALEAHLGHPLHDPHGDPIPAADGTMDSLKGVPLTDWPSGEPALVVHIEDEPDLLFQQILATGLRPGVTVRVIEQLPERIVISDGEREHLLAPVVAANIQVAEQRRPPARPAGAKRLSDVADQEIAEVFEIGPACQGYSRRRLLDLGLTPGTRVQVALGNPFGEPRAFRVRGTTIALRNQQTDQIWVKPVAAESQAAPRPDLPAVHAAGKKIPGTNSAGANSAGANIA